MAEKLQDVLASISERLKAGVAPWRQPWVNGADPCRPLRANGEPFSGSNAMLLAMFAAARTCGSPYWLTYKQAQTLGAQVRRGAKGAPAILYRSRVVDGAEGEDDRVLKFLNTYVVFNADDIEGLNDTFRNAPPVDLDKRAQARDRVLSAVPADLRHAGSKAFYNPKGDYIQLPPVERFQTVDDYRSTWAHELGHWTGAEARLNRSFGARFGDQAYAFEELVAEGISLLLGLEIGVRPQMLDSHAAYLEHWGRLLEHRPNALVEAFGHAQRATDYLLAFSQVDAGADRDGGAPVRLAA